MWARCWATRKPHGCSCGLAQFLPAIGLSLVTGHVADRFDRRRVAIEFRYSAIDDFEDRATKLFATDGCAIEAGKTVMIDRNVDHGRSDGSGDAVHVHVAELARLHPSLEDGGEHVARAAAGLLELEAAGLGKLGRLDLAHQHEVELARLTAWCRGLPSARFRDNIAILVALGLGAGR